RQLENAETALRILERARQLGFETRAYYLRRAMALERAGKPEEADQQRKQAAIRPLQSALDHFLLGEEQYQHEEWLEAKRSFSRALAVQPDYFWARFFLAVCHLKTQQWAAARAGLDACLAQQPDFVWAYVFRSFASEKLRALPEAEADLH